jgi:glucose-1-phosphate adenylyltransferase
LVFGADHIYRMDPHEMLTEHMATGADVTVAGIRVPRSEASAFGIIDCDADGRIRAFLEKPTEPPGLADSPDESLASMGNYVFRTEALLEMVARDAANGASDHDVGRDIIPPMVDAGRARMYDFATNDVPGATDRDRGYWRDVGTIDAYYDAHMDLISVHPIFNLYNRQWPIYSWNEPRAPAKFVFDEDQRRGSAVDSMVCAGTLVSGGTVRRSVLSQGVSVHTGALVEGTILMEEVDVGRGAVVRNAIVDKQVRIPPGARIGVDAAADRRRFTISASGVVVIGKRQIVPSE